MSRSYNEQESLLRNILLAATDQIEPRADGLDRIQSRLTRPYPLPVAWAATSWTRLSLRMPPGLGPALRSALGSAADRLVLEFRQATERFMPSPPRTGAHGSRLQLGWLRPLAAMSVAVFTVAAVVYMAIEVPQVISPAGSTSNAQHNGGNSTGNGGPGGHARSQPGSGGVAGTGQPGYGYNSAGCATPAGPGKHIITPGPSPSTHSPSQTTSPSPTPSTTSPSPTSTPTPTGSASATNTAAAPGVGSPSPGAVTSTNSGSGASSAGAGSKAGSVGNAVNSTLAKLGGKPRAAHPSASPCASPKPTKRPSSRTVSPGIVGALAQPNLAVTQTKGRVS